MTRIRYSESNGTLTSKPLVAGEKLLVVKIDTVNNRYSLLEGSNEVAFGEAVDVSLLKKKAKLAAAQLGVVFQDEVRRREEKVVTE